MPEAAQAEQSQTPSVKRKKTRKPSSAKRTDSAEAKKSAPKSTSRDGTRRYRRGNSRRRREEDSRETPNQHRSPAAHRRGMFIGSDYADRRHFSIIQNDPAALEKIRAEVGETDGSHGTSTQRSSGLSYSTDQLRQNTSNSYSFGSTPGYMFDATRRRRVHLQSADLFENFSPVQKDRVTMTPARPRAFMPGATVNLEPSDVPGLAQFDEEALRQHFPYIFGQPTYAVVDDLDPPPTPPVVSPPASNRLYSSQSLPLNVGLVLSGGPAPGGHNVIAGVFDYIKSVNQDSRLIGFKGGLDGVFRKEYTEIDEMLLRRFRNTGGFDMIWSGRGKVTEEEKPLLKEAVLAFRLNGLVIVGGDGSNSNAALIAEFLAGEDLPQPCSVVGVPKTIDGDLKNEAIECSFGFDTAAKTYSESIGNLCVDCRIGQGVWHFVRVMGRSASHLVLECAMQTRPNLVYVGEEVERDNTSLKQIVEEIADLIQERWKQNKRYGVVLVPEGLVGFIPEFKILIDDMTKILVDNAQVKVDCMMMTQKLQGPSLELWKFLPNTIRQQLMEDREATGYVQVAKIATERLLILSVEDVLRNRGFPIKQWNRMHHYFGYEGRCAMPSNFDANYCYNLGLTAGALIHHDKNGYMAVVKNLKALPTDWVPMGVPFTRLMKMLNLPNGVLIPGVIRQLVDLESESFKVLSQVRPHWKFGDYYRCPGPVQFTGPIADITNYVIDPPSATDLLAGTESTETQLRLVGRAKNPIRFGCYSTLQKARLQFIPEVPPACKSLFIECVKGGHHPPEDPYLTRQIYNFCSSMCSDNQFYIQEIRTRDGTAVKRNTHTHARNASPEKEDHGCGGTDCSRSTRVGVVFLSRQAPGMQNILWGVHERCKLNGGVCLGFKGVEGLLSKDYIEIEDEDLQPFKNLGGTDLLGRATEHVLMAKEKWDQVLQVATQLKLDGLVLVGSSLAMTEAAYLANFFMERKSKCCVIGVPATASNNLSHKLIETNVGFDTASKLYSSLIGNVLTDAASMPKYWHFVRLMGRQPSNEVLECALQTHPNVVIVAEEYGLTPKTLKHVVTDIANIVCRRADCGGKCRNFGAVIIPDGLWHYLPTFRIMLEDVDRVISDATNCGCEKQAREQLVDASENAGKWMASIPSWSAAAWRDLPDYIRAEFLTSDTELRLSFVETEMLLSQMVATELEERKKRGEYKGVFQCVCHYFGYQGRSAMPSVFDATLGFVHGHLAVMCVESRLGGYITTIRGLCERISNWKLGAIPFNCLMTLVPSQQDATLHPMLLNRNGEMPVMPNAEINLEGKAFRWLKLARPSWVEQDQFCNPGPIQFWGTPSTFYNRILHEEQAEYSRMLRHTQKYAQMLKDACDFGVDEEFLKFVFTSLHGLLFLQHHPDSLVEDIGRLRPRHQRDVPEVLLDDDSTSSDANE